MHKPTILATSNTIEMAEFPPVEIGTRGTVGSLLMQEIEYFSRLKVNSQDWSQKNKSQTINIDSSISIDSRPTTVSRVESTKKKRSSSKLLPRICSVVDVSDNSKTNFTSAFSYKNLKSDIKFQL
uniref:Uncharacterized protein n=1 Tax=Cajanus cajan TaxID=3821 RepID=A0A151T1K3_CAJCA|nr:hypothetical protein KK1_023298 [Cajanus cajan]